MRSAVLFLLLLGCDGLETATTARPAIYGEDARTEVSLHPLGARAASVLAIGVGARPDVMQTLGEVQRLCPGEPFADQPVLPTCTGVLVGADRVLTAAHCADTCDAMWLAFDFAFDARGALPAIDDVYGCAEVLAVADADDVAVIRLDRATDRAPMPLRAPGTMKAGEPVVVIGHPSGLPAKIDDGGRVVDEIPFLLSTDTFAGSSGSPVLDGDGRLAGIVVGGATDYEDAGGCARAIAYGDGEGYELAVPIDRVRAMLEAGGCTCVSGRAGHGWVLLVLLGIPARRHPRPARAEATPAVSFGRS